MAYKFDINKNSDLISKAEDMDTQDILQYSLINKYPIALVVDKSGNNLIHLTINNPKKIKSEFNKLNFIKFLIQNNVNPDQPNKENQTPLHLACQFQYESIIDLLLEYEVNTNYKDNNGLTPLHYLYTGNIKLFQEKEIKEFIIPNKPKDNIINRDDLLTIKKDLWDLLQNNEEYKLFLKVLTNTIDESIKNSPDFTTKLNEFKIDLGSININNTDQKLINDKFKNWKSKLNEIAEGYWKKFPNDDNIVINESDNNSLSIIKNINVKEEIKMKLKETIKGSLDMIKQFTFDKYDENASINKIIETFFEQNFAYFNPIPGINPPTYVLADPNIKLEINNEYIKNKQINTIDVADNIIDYDNYTFIGGPRNIGIDMTNYVNIYTKITDNTFDNFNKKIIYILLCYFIDPTNIYDLAIILEIKKLNNNNNNYKDILDNIKLLCGNINDDYINFIKDDIIGPIFNYNINENKNLYSKYIQYITTENHTNLNGQINLIIIRLFAALINDPMSLEVSFYQVIKIDQFTDCINNYNLKKTGTIANIPNNLDTINDALTIWTSYLLYNNIKNDYIYANAIANLDIKNIINKITDKTIDRQIIVDDINKYYDDLTTKFPKIYLLDLIHYILNPQILLDMVTNNAEFNTIIQEPYKLVEKLFSYIDPVIVNANYTASDAVININKNITNIIYKQLPPSLSSYIYIYLDNSYNNYIYDHIQAANAFVLDATNNPAQLASVYYKNIFDDVIKYLNNKHTEAYNLGLSFYGCIPNLMSLKYNSSELKLQFDNNTVFLFNPYINQDPLNFFTGANYDTPLPFNFFYDTTIPPINNYVKTTYFKYVEGIYRPVSTITYENYINQLNNKLNEIISNQLTNNNKNYNSILKELLDKKQNISSIYDTLFVTTKLIIEKQKKIIDLFKINKQIDNNFTFDSFTENLNNINAYIFLYYYLYKPTKRIPQFIYNKLNSDKYTLYNNTNSEIDIMTGGKNNIMTGGENYINMSIKNKDYHIYNNKFLPPSIYDNLELFYQLIKKKFIVEFIESLKNRIVATAAAAAAANITIDAAATAAENAAAAAAIASDPTNIRAINASNIANINADIAAIAANTAANNVFSAFAPNNAATPTYFYNISDDLNTKIDTYFKSKLMIKDEDKETFKYYNIAKLIEEIIKNYADYILKIKIDKIFNDTLTDPLIGSPKLEPVNKPFEISVVLKNTIDSINNIYNDLNNANVNILKYFYNISDPNILDDNNQDLFIIYPNEYTNTNLLSQKYCIDFKNNIIEKLLNKQAHPLLLDNNNQYFIHNAVKSFNYNSLKLSTTIDLKMFGSEINFIERELINHKNKMVLNNYVSTFENFIKTQFEEIKILILSNEANGNNILFNLHNSFKMCFYIMNEYITDNLWRFNNKYNNINFNSITNKLNNPNIIYNSNNINISYLYKFYNNNKSSIPKSDENLIKKDFIEIFKKNKIELNKKLDIYRKEKNSNKKLKISNVELNIKITNIKNKIIEIDNKIKQFNRLTKVSTIPKNIIKNKIIETYDKFSKDNYGVYSKIWDSLFKNENALSNSFNLSLIQILNLQYNNNIINNNDDIILYLDHMESLAKQYFENPKYIDQKINKNLNFIYDLLIHLTKTIICFGIEIITRKVLFNHLYNVYNNYTVDDINTIISRLFNEKINLAESKSFTEMLYTDYPEIIVKNSINMYKDLNEKVNFEPLSVNEMLQNLFRLLNNAPEVVELDEIIMNNLNKNIANYFDLFTARVIKNWFVVCENTLKFVINHQRISKTLKLFR